MSLVLSLLLGATCGTGLLLVVLGLRGVEPKPEQESEAKPSIFSSIEDLNLRLAIAVVAVVVVWYLSRWPVGIVLAACGGLTAPTLAGAKRRRQAAIAKTEAIASWSEQLRDIIGTSSGLQEAISASSRVAPAVLRDDVRTLAVEQRRLAFGDAIRRFAARVDDPAADQVALALLLAAERRGQSLAAVLDDVAIAAREEATMMDRTETSRAQSYNESLAVTSIVLVMFVGMLVFNRAYLEAFDSLAGQTVLGVVGIGWGFAFVTLVQLSKVRRPDRLLSLTTASSEVQA